MMPSIARRAFFSERIAMLKDETTKVHTSRGTQSVLLFDTRSVTVSALHLLIESRRNTYVYEKRNLHEERKQLITPKYDKLEALFLQKPFVMILLAWLGFLVHPLTTSGKSLKNDSYRQRASSAVGAADITTDSVTSLGAMLRLRISCHQWCILT